MKILKTSLAVLAVVVGTVARAQEKTPEERAQMKTDRMAKELSLSDEQKAKVMDATLSSIKDREAIKDNKSLNDQQCRAAFKSRRDAQVTEIRRILTEEQFTKLKELKTANHEERKNRTPEQKAQFRTDRMSTELSLTEDQKTKIAASNLKTVQQEDVIRKDATKTDDQKKQAMKELHTSQKAEMKQILTKEQLDQLKAKKEAHKGDHKGNHPKK